MAELLKTAGRLVGARAKTLAIPIAIGACVLFSQFASAAMYSTGTFIITSINYSAANNMQVRVAGMPSMSYCPGASWFAYVDEADSGGKTKIAALIAAQIAGRPVSMTVEPVDYYGNGQLFCRIAEFGVLE